MISLSTPQILPTIALCLTLFKLALSISQIGRFAANYPAAVPSFVVIGTSKSGTTDLFEQLVNTTVNDDPSRPDPPIKTMYEFTHRWKQKELGNLYFPPTPPEEWLLGRSEFMRYLNDLRHPCANVTLELLRACVDTAGHKQYTFDASPGYLQWSTAAYRLAALSPFTKVIAMLRDPVERAESLCYHWSKNRPARQNQTLDSLVDEFLDVTLKKPGVEATLQRLQACLTAACHASNWRDMVGLGDPLNPHWIIFCGSLYTYELGAWRSAYLQPGRMMVIDSHMFYRNRSAVMEQVIFFLYGRPMTSAEAKLAAGEYIANFGLSRLRQQAATNGTNTSMAAAPAPAPAAVTTPAGSKPWWQLSPHHRDRLRAFYQQHLYSRLQLTLQELRDEGAWVVGFDREPWVATVTTASSGPDSAQHGAGQTSGSIG